MFGKRFLLPDSSSPIGESKTELGIATRVSSENDLIVCKKDNLNLLTTQSLATNGSAFATSSSTASTIVMTGTTQRLGPHPIAIKLKDGNYLLSKQQAVANIKDYKLQQFILGAQAVSKKYLSPEDDAQDALLPKLVGCYYSYQAWEKLEQFFASQTRPNVRQFMAQLRNLKKGTSSTKEYLLKIKKLANTLFSVGSPVSEADHIEAILEGLFEEYNNFVVSMTSRSDPYTVDEIELLLVAEEERIEKFKKDSEAVAPMTANLVQSQAKGGKQNLSQPVQNKGQFYNNNNNNNNTRGGFRGRGRNGRGGRGNSYGGNRPQCQVCSKVGHMAWQCYHRFDPQFISPFSMGGSQLPSSSNGNNFRPNANMAAVFPSFDQTTMMLLGTQIHGPPIMLHLNTTTWETV
ncbi:Retrovirus-related Pol polyprotein from transposon TNT 1-94 [Senna tora]|uniref:Retrovirus-related Pol polyprotein from transposon TNT 1-94 n=1 Tax=Senna tora TaxID=362788 RepID=A0A834STJ4_9FABA|nr:Retrovirus-related Pol polyprotein from transposon TNT 1-94 [Senna tora]